jgi:hypothetical protein
VVGGYDKSNDGVYAATSGLAIVLQVYANAEIVETVFCGGPDVQAPFADVPYYEDLWRRYGRRVLALTNIDYGANTLSITNQKAIAYLLEKCYTFPKLTVPGAMPSARLFDTVSVTEGPFGYSPRYFLLTNLTLGPALAMSATMQDFSLRWQQTGLGGDNV